MKYNAGLVKKGKEQGRDGIKIIRVKAQECILITYPYKVDYVEDSDQ